MITSTELELRSTLILGTLESNAAAIKEIVEAKLEEYRPELYQGKADEAKKDRAVLNNAEKALNAKRLELERIYMEPFNTFKQTIKDTCDSLKKASAKLGEIVKTEENREKDEKLAEIQRYWDSTGFNLYELQKIMDQKWLGKTTKMKDVQAAIDAKQKQTFDDLQVIDNFPAEDIALIKTVYLETLSITEAMNKAKQLKDNRDRLAREKLERAEMEKRQALAEQRRQEKEDINEAFQETYVGDLATEALGLEITEKKQPAIETYTLVLKGTRDQLLEVRKFMTGLGVSYEKL